MKIFYKFAKNISTWRGVQEGTGRRPAGVNERQAWWRQWKAQEALLACLVASSLLIPAALTALVSVVMLVPGSS